MLSKVYFFGGVRNVGVGNNSRGNCSGGRGFCHLSRNFALSFFLRIPIVSFYPKTLLAIGILKSLPDIEDTLSGRLYSSTLKIRDTYFDSISKIIKTVYDIQNSFDEIKFKRSEQFILGFNETTNKPIYHGGECFFELLDNNKFQARIHVNEDSFSDIKHELDRIARKRLAMVIFVFGIAAVLVGVLN